MTSAVQRVLRFIYYFITTCCLVYLGNVLQNVAHNLLLRVGFTDVLTLGGLLDLVSDLPIFTNIPADVVVLVIGVIGWLLIRHDRKTTSEGRGGVIRAIFLAVLVCFIGLRILLSVVLIVRNLDALSQPSSLPIASPLAAVIAWGIALVLVVLEWAKGGKFEEAGQKIAVFFALLGQWIVLVMAIWAIAQTVQSLLQTAIAPLPLCSRELDIPSQLLAFISRFAQTCTDTAPIPGALVTMLVILLVFYAYIRWATLDKETWGNSIWLRNLDAMIGATVTGVIIVLYSVLGIRFILDIVTGHTEAVIPQSLLSTPGEFGLASYPFLGPFVAGLIMLVVYFWRERRRVSESDDSSGLGYGIMMLSFVVGPVFFAGASLLLGHVFLAIMNRLGYTEASVSPDDWSFAWMLLIPGLLYGALLWRDLHAMGRGGPIGVPRPGRIYVRVFLWGTELVAGVSFAFFVALVLSDVLDMPMEAIANRFAPYTVATILVMTPFIRYYRDLKLRWPNK